MSEIRFATFSLNIPEDALPEWTLSTVILAGPTVEIPVDPRMSTLKVARPFQSNIVATLEQVDPNETPESYVKRQIDGLRKAGVSRQEAAPPKKVELSSDLNGYLTEQVIVSAEGEQVRQLQLVIIKNGLAHTLIASQLDGSPFEQMRSEFQEILLSFKST